MSIAVHNFAMDRRRMLLFAALIGLLVSVMVTFMFTPRFTIWRGMWYSQFSKSSELERGLYQLEQIEDPFAPVNNEVHKILRFRLLIPLIWHFTGLPKGWSLLVPHVGCLLAAWYFATITLQRTGKPWGAFIFTSLLCCNSWFFVSMGWLSYADSLLVLALLGAAFSSSRRTLFACSLLGPWIDERYVLSLPVIMLCRWFELSWSSKSAQRQMLVDLGSASPVIVYLLVRLGAFIGRVDDVTESYVAFHVTLFREIPGQLLLHGAWSGFRMAWLLVPAAACVAWQKNRPAHAVATLVLTVAYGFGCVAYAADMSRNYVLLMPLLALSMLQLYASWPVFCLKFAGVLLVAQLVLPAHHVMWHEPIPIRYFYSELDQWNNPPPQLTPMYHTELAADFAQQNNIEQALASFDLAIRLDSTFAPAFLKRGLLNAKLGQLQRAEADLDQAVRAEPRWPDSYWYRGLFRLQHRIPGAVEDLQEALRVAPDTWPQRDECLKLLASLHNSAKNGAVNNLPDSSAGMK